MISQKVVSWGLCIFMVLFLTPVSTVALETDTGDDTPEGASVVTINEGNELTPITEAGSGKEFDHNLNGNEDDKADSYQPERLEPEDAAPVAYPITFLDEGNNATTICVKDGEAIGELLPAAPNRGEAYVFESWATEKGEPVNETTVVHGPMTVVAQFRYYPTGSASVITSNDMVIVSADWGEGVFPEGTKMAISYLGKEKALAMAKEALPKGEAAVDDGKYQHSS